MRIIIDTEAFLHWIADDPRLSEHARETIENTDNELFLSGASAMEMATKIRLKQLILNNPLSFVTEQMHLNMIKPLPVDISHGLYVSKLPNFHQDPYDRIILAQATLESMSILTSDKAFVPYKVDVIW
jgi:PIN domain nuclease of toxin-antitoxin system